MAAGRPWSSRPRAPAPAPISASTKSPSAATTPPASSPTAPPSTASRIWCRGWRRCRPLIMPAARASAWPSTNADALFGAHPRIGVVGLGSGTLSCYARPNQAWTFFEIDPAMVQVARNRFTFLSRCAPQVRIVLGDARLSLARQPRQFARHPRRRRLLLGRGADAPAHPRGAARLRPRGAAATASSSSTSPTAIST